MASQGWMSVMHAPRMLCRLHPTRAAMREGERPSRTGCPVKAAPSHHLLASLAAASALSDATLAFLAATLAFFLAVVAAFCAPLASTLAPAASASVGSFFSEADFTAPVDTWARAKPAPAVVDRTKA